MSNWHDWLWAHDGLQAREGMQWVRRDGLWREEPLPPAPPPKTEVVYPDGARETYEDPLYGATYADAYDGPLALCDTCCDALETEGALAAGRCSQCVVMRRTPEPPAFDPMEWRAPEQ